MDGAVGKGGAEAGGAGVGDARPADVEFFRAACLARSSTAASVILAPVRSRFQGGKRGQVGGGRSETFV